MLDEIVILDHIISFIVHNVVAEVIVENAKST